MTLRSFSVLAASMMAICSSVGVKAAFPMRVSFGPFGYRSTPPASDNAFDSAAQAGEFDVVEFECRAWPVADRHPGNADGDAVVGAANRDLAVDAERAHTREVRLPFLPEPQGSHPQGLPDCEDITD